MTDEPIDDLDAWVDAAAPPQRSVELCTRGDLFPLWEAANRRLEQAAKSLGGKRLGTPPDLAALAAEVRDIEAQMAAATRTVTFRALGPDESYDLSIAHKPRKGNEKDQALGYNHSAVRDATIRACTLTPPLTAEQWDRLQPNLSDHQVEECYTACNAVTYNKFTVPFSPAASVISPASGGDSTPPEPSESLQESSKAGGGEA